GVAADAVGNLSGPAAGRLRRERWAASCIVNRLRGDRPAAGVDFQELSIAWNKKRQRWSDERVQCRRRMFVRVDKVSGPGSTALKRRLPLPPVPQSFGRANVAVRHVSDRAFHPDQWTARRVSVIAAGDPQFLRSVRNLLDLPARGLC